MEKTKKNEAHNRLIATEKQQGEVISFGNDELFEDFINEFENELKAEFLAGRSDDLLSDYEINFEFGEFCKSQFKEWIVEMRYKYA